MKRGRPIVFIVDDDEHCAEAMADVLEHHGYRTRSFSSAEDFLKNVSGVERGCLLLDLVMPGMNGLQLQQKLNAEEIDLPIVFLTGFGTVEWGVRAMKSGACDFLEKPIDSESLLAVVAEALAVDAAAATRRKEKASLLARYAQLSPREKEVLDLIVRGMTNREAGNSLNISEKTVKVHRARIKAKMQLGSLPELVLAAKVIGRV